MKRRDFITLLGSAAAAWQVVARAQRRIPVIGFISSISPEELAEPVAGFHKGLGEAGYVEDRNVAIEYRWARGNNDRLPEFAADCRKARFCTLPLSSADQAWFHRDRSYARAS